MIACNYVYVFYPSADQGFKLGSEKHTTEVIVKKSGALQLSSGIEGMSVVKTTKVNFSPSLC